MLTLQYTKKADRELVLSCEIYPVNSFYGKSPLKDYFLNMKAHLIDLNPALITKCIMGMEQDFCLLMDKARDYMEAFYGLSKEEKSTLLNAFKDCVFGYYVLTPLLLKKDISDIKVLAWNKITVKSYGKRYLTDLSFYSEEDYNDFYTRLLRIHHLSLLKEDAIKHTTDLKSFENDTLRIDFQDKSIVSGGANNLHIRKLPKKKSGFSELISAGMLTEEMFSYLKDRMAAGYGFLLSGRGGSGKTTLLNGLLDLIPYDESVLVCQESDELYSMVHPQIQFEHTIEAVRKGDAGNEISLEEELRMGLLQDIDNFVIGEIKGGEALYCFTTAMSTGARFFGTIHSNTAVSSVRRLSQCARYISDYSIETLEEMLTQMPISLIHMSHFHIDEIYEVDGFLKEEGHLNYKKIYKEEEKS